MQMTHSPNQTPSYLLRKAVGYWDLVYHGERTVFRHEHGAYYIAFLLLDPPEEPIHGLALAMKTRAKYEYSPHKLDLTDPVTGEQVTASRDAVFQQRNLGLDEADAARTLRRRQRQLEALVEDPTEIEPVRLEAARELEAIYRTQRNSKWRADDAASRCVHALRRAIGRFRQRLHCAKHHNPVLAAFSHHLDQHLAASGRHPALVPIPPGCFYYDRPSGVVWRE